MNDNITDEELKQMKLQVKQEMDKEERKRVYSLIKRRADLLTDELKEMKEKGERPTVSFLRQSYNISGKALHMKIQKIFGTDYANTEPTLKAKRKTRILVHTDGLVDVEKTVEKLQTTRSISEAPTLEDIKKLKKMGTEKTIEWLRKVATGTTATELITSEQAQALLSQEN